MTPPRKLYKYRAFDAHALQLLQGAIYYSEPSYFNDPLDCDPAIQVTHEVSELEDLLTRMLEDANANAAATIKNLRYHAENVEEGNRVHENHRWLLRDEIKRSLMQEFSGFGVLSLAEKWDCPLMWSHYADQHKGICIEFDTSEHNCRNLAPVDYQSSRVIDVSDILAWKLHGEEEAGEKIRRQIFYSKAPQWKYEREWRSVDAESGLKHLPFNVSAVYFGMNCSYVVEECLVKLCRDTDISLRNVRAEKNGFKLTAHEYDAEDWGMMLAQPVGRAGLFPSDDFDDVAES